MTVEDRARRIEAFIQNDPFARWLGAHIEVVRPGHGRATLTVTDDMANYHGITHGGVVFALGDIAFGAASNSRGQTAVALNVAINYLKASRSGDRLVAEAVEQHGAGPTALYAVTIRDADTGDLIASSQNLVYRKKDWFVPEDEREA